MLKIIKYGFCPIKHNLEKKQNFVKGSKLLQAGHVLKVVETENSEEKQSNITAQVVAQTNVGTQYTVQIKLNDNRDLQSASCSCKAGLSGKCKHVCAVILYVNSDLSSLSKTSYSQKWGQPSTRQQLGYDKGAKIAELFSPPTLSKEASDLLPINLSSKTLGPSLSHTPLYTMTKFEECTNSEIIAAETLANMARISEKEELLSKCEKVVTDIFILQDRNLHQFSSEIFITQESLDFYVNNVVCDVSTATKIAVETIDQSSNKNWYKERSYRITASNAHRAKGTPRDKDKLVDDLLNPSKLQTSAMTYGKKTEKVALKKFEQTFLQPESYVIQTGLIINILQPWLACSPDGIIVYGDEISDKRLLEIKCPEKCRNKSVYDSEAKKVNVKYLELDENDALQLKPTSYIYTQTQLQMYVTNITICDLYVYSSQGSQLIKVYRDNFFLEETILKLEKFYFNYYLPKLVTKASQI